MSRSVATHPHAYCTVYFNLSEELSGLDCHDEFESFVNDIQNALSGRFPSLRYANRSGGREVLVILESYRAEVSVSEYCGLVAVCLAPGEYDNKLDLNWCQQVTASFKDTLHNEFPGLALRSLGRASNGEQFFAPLDNPAGLVTSKEGTLW